MAAKGEKSPEKLILDKIKKNRAPYSLVIEGSMSEGAKNPEQQLITREETSHRSVWNQGATRR